MRPLTQARPKPIVPLLNIPFLAYQLALLKRHGVHRAVLSCSYMVDEVRRAMGDGSRFGVELAYAVEETPLGTAGGVRNAADLVRGRVVVLNGDILTDADITAMLRFHAERDARASIYLTPVEDPGPYGLVDVAEDGRVRRFIEKPSAEDQTTNTINAGIYVLDAALLERIPPARVVSIEREFFPALVRLSSISWPAAWPPMSCPTAPAPRDDGSPRTWPWASAWTRRRPWSSARAAGSRRTAASAPPPFSAPAARSAPRHPWRAPSSGSASPSARVPSCVTASWARAPASVRTP